MGLTVLSYFLSGETSVNMAISIVAIGLTTSLALESKRAAEALRESEEQWQEVFEHNPVMYFVVSPTGTVLSVNGFGAAQLGYTAAELIGQSVLNVFFEQDRELVKDHVATCLTELGPAHSWEIRKVRKDGTALWVRENAKAVRRSGNDVMVLIACEDITERKHSEQRVAAQYAVTRILAEANSLATATPHILRAIGENLEWDWGALWSFDRDREKASAPLRCDYLWHAPDLKTAEFDAASRERSFTAGEGRLGQVWRATNPIWMGRCDDRTPILARLGGSAGGAARGRHFPRDARHRSPRGRRVLQPRGSGTRCGAACDTVGDRQPDRAVHQTPAGRSGRACQRGALAQAV
jgi:PAS domain S-box-containing protein